MKLLPIAALVILAAPPALAASESDFAAAFATAEKAEQEALSARNAWTVTETALADAKKAADAKNYDAATALARQAEALANASIAQAREQKTAWRDNELR
jgi:hypothetical protein